MKIRSVIILNSHPIQYFAPLYKKMANESNIDLMIWYCSDESIRGEVDKGFNSKVKWDIPLLDGYKSRFLKNYSPISSIYKGFWGLINLKVIKLLYKQPKSIVWIHGWSYFTHIITIIFAKLFGHTVCLRAETPLNQELIKPKFFILFKNIILKILFIFVDKFLYIGKQNFDFYKSLNISDDQLIPVLYCVDNDRFREVFEHTNKQEAREKLVIHSSKKIILFSGKYIKKKRPMDLLKAFTKINNKDSILIMLGDGEMRKEMEDFITYNKLTDDVILTGFVNQSLIPFYYRAADLFVMCSGSGETWGLSVNEAMNFGIPVIVSDICGCSIDLIENDKNGNIFQMGDLDALTKLIDKYTNLEKDKLKIMEDFCFQKINQYNYSQIISTINIINK